uniref:Uncharacterized protein n=1 Tax=Setaria digitata TaxID=48799 RepID=A0A915PSF1_9BILA
MKEAKGNRTENYFPDSSRIWEQLELPARMTDSDVECEKLEMSREQQKRECASLGSELLVLVGCTKLRPNVSVGTRPDALGVILLGPHSDGPHRSSPPSLPRYTCN